MRLRQGSLFWRVCAVNGLVLLVGTAALALSPARVSQDVLLSEAVVLLLGLVVILVTNGLLLRGVLGPLDRLTGLMTRVDLLHPGQRLDPDGSGGVEHVIAGFNGMLERLEQERSTSAALAVEAQEEERARIARELHDEIGQSLTVVLLGLRRAADQAPEELAADLRALLEHARESLDEVGRVARRLRPVLLEDLGLGSALGALVQEISGLCDLHVQRSLDLDLPPLPRSAELVLYRVAQEALTNAVRHADAEEALVSLRREPDAVVLSVEDDGTGLQDRGEGSGIRGMRERALLVGAELSLGPGLHGRGTGVRLRLPVPQAVRVEAGRATRPLDLRVRTGGTA